MIRVNIQFCLMYECCEIQVVTLQHASHTPISTFRSLNTIQKVAGSNPALVNFSLFTQNFYKNVTSQFPLWSIT